MLIFGSCAVKHWYPGYKLPNDLDIISPDHYWIPAFEYLIKNNQHNQYVDPNFLYTIKVSHAAWDIHWNKTMKDIAFLKNKGCILDHTFYKLLIKDWEILHGKKHVKLSVRNDDFFTKKITRKYDHDWLHEQLCFYDRPLHEKIRNDLNFPLCDKKLFDNLIFPDKIKLAMEEVHVIMTERYILNENLPVGLARTKAVKNLITSMTTGWFNLFLIENVEILMTYPLDFIKQKLTNLEILK